MNSLWQDVKYAFRTFRNSPGFTALAVTALALGMGANTALFSMVYAVLLRPLPYPEAGRLVAVWEDHQKRGGPEREWTNPATFYDWSDRSHEIEAMFALDGWGPTLTGEGEPDPLTGARVTQGIFTTLRLETLVPIAVGVALGVAGAWSLARAISGLLYGITPGDPATLTATALLLLGTSILASFLPARRAAKVDPVTALRSE